MKTMMEKVRLQMCLERDFSAEKISADVIQKATPECS